MLLLLWGALGNTLYAMPQKESQQKTDETLSIFVSIAPQRYFVERIGGTMVDVALIVPENRDSHTYDPSPRQIQALGAADVWFTIGVEFEEYILPRIARTVEHLNIVDTTANITFREISKEANHNNERHDENDEKKSDPGSGYYHGKDPHTWLGTDEVALQAKVIYETLLALIPDARATLTATHGAFLKDIEQLNSRLTMILSPVRNNVFYATHPAFGYFADTYGLRYVAIETRGNEPSPIHIEEMIENARSTGVKLIIVSPQFSQIAATNIAEAIGGTVEFINPTAENWLENMESFARAIRGSTLR